MSSPPMLSLVIAALQYIYRHARGPIEGDDMQITQGHGFFGTRLLAMSGVHLAADLLELHAKFGGKISLGLLDD